MPGPYVYTQVSSLEGTDKVGSESCVALVQYYTRPGLTSTWSEGTQVKGNGDTIRKGTAIATFVDGKYPNRSTGNHAAYYIEQDASGIWIMDQWKGSTKLKVSKRKVRFLGTKDDGSYENPSNNGDAFSVIL